MKLDRAFVGLTLVAGIAAGCEVPAPPEATPSSTIAPSTEVAPQPPQPPQPGGAYLSDTDKHTISSAFETGKAYIESRHVGSTATLRLITLEGNAQAACEQTTFTSTGPGPEYCNSIATVLFDAQFADKDVPAILAGAKAPAKALPNLTSDALKYVISHELGHHLQIVEDPTSFIQTTLQKEQQADCLAGEILRTTDPSVVSGASVFIEHMPGDPAHGTPQERAAKFMQGANGGACVTTPQ